MQAKPLRPRPLRKHTWILQVSFLFCFFATLNQSLMNLKMPNILTNDGEERERESLAFLFALF